MTLVLMDDRIVELSFTEVDNPTFQLGRIAAREKWDGCSPRNGEDTLLFQIGFWSVIFEELGTCIPFTYQELLAAFPPSKVEQSE